MEDLYVYDWCAVDPPIDPSDYSRFNDPMIMRAFCIDSRSSGSITRLDITGFRPFMYASLPPVDRGWVDTNASSVIGAMIAKMGYHRDCPRGGGCGFCWPLSIAESFSFQKRMMLYEGHIDGSVWVLRISFPNQHVRRKCRWKLNNCVISVRSCRYTVRVHEADVTPTLQMTTTHGLPTVGWVSIDKGTEMTRADGDRVVRIDLKRMRRSGREGVPSPTILSFDIEVFSSDPSRMPCAKVSEDAIFQVGMVVQSQQGGIKKTLMTICPSPGMLTSQWDCDAELVVCRSEEDLLLRFAAAWRDARPNVVIGYNIFGFDIPYMVARAEANGVLTDFLRLGVMGEPATVEEVSWSSSAYRDQHFVILMTPGVIGVDLLPLIRRDFKLSNYKLKTVSSHFIGDTKDPMSAQDLFRAYRNCCLCDHPKDMRELVSAGRYCVQDVDLVLRLWNHLDSWIGLCEMAGVCQVSIWALYIKGQQIKVFSQIYRKCQEIRCVINSPTQALSSHGYTGATVFPPDPGMYAWVVSFDFASLYPTTIIAYNIDYSTYVPPTRIKEYDPDSIHRIEWEEHIGCEHDATHYTASTRPSETQCGMRSFCFLKSPKGVLPSILETLLDQRKETRSVIKKLRKDDPLRQVLDKRQLAYKVSANSMYGAMGVSKGYLPFMVGAMCTTAMGRQNIEKAAEFVKRVYGAKLVYGDSVAGHTPITVRVHGKFMVVRIDDIVSDKSQWQPGDGGKEHAELVGVEAWTEDGWTEVRRIIRHRLPADKKMVRVIGSTCVVDITEDHSLVDADGAPITAAEMVAKGARLMHRRCGQGHATIVGHPVATTDQVQCARVVRAMEAAGMSYEIEVSGDVIRVIPMVHPPPVDRKYRVVPLRHTDGYVYDLTTDNHHFAAGVGDLVVHNTDSIYVHFPGMSTAAQIWEHALRVEERLVSLFPSPMRLVFEEKVFKQFLILTKKRYMALTCSSPDGSIDRSLTIRGVLLARRDNCAFVRRVYETVVRSIMQGMGRSEVANVIHESVVPALMGLCPLGDFVVTKLLASGYVVCPLPDDPTKRTKRLKDLGIRSGASQCTLSRHEDSCRTIQAPPPIDAGRLVMTVVSVRRVFPKDAVIDSGRLCDLWRKHMGTSETPSEWGDPGGDMCEVVKRVMASSPDKAVIVMNDKKTMGEVFSSDKSCIAIVRRIIRNHFGLSEDHDLKAHPDMTIQQLQRILDKERWAIVMDGVRHCRGCECTLCLFRDRSLPAHAQLARRMGLRGSSVEPGTRMEYCITRHVDDPKARLSLKLEDPDYIRSSRGLIRVDVFYYLDLLCNALDQLCTVCFKTPVFEQQLRIYKARRECMSMIEATPEIIIP